MNTYEAHKRWLAPPPASPLQNDEVGAPSDVAVHGDPSRKVTVTAPLGVRSDDPGRRIAWVRPSELPTVVMTPMVGRGIDLQSELMRRARREPVAAARRTRITRITRTAIARPEPSTPTQGVQL